jgi:cell division protein FtsA
MYATCVGLILKGYNDYENDRRALEENYVKINTSYLAKEQAANASAPEESDWEQEPTVEQAQEKRVRERNASLKTFLDRMKTKIIDMFTEEEDAKL